MNNQLEQFAENELRVLLENSKEFSDQVQTILESEFGYHRFPLPLLKQLRLLNLKTACKRFSISLQSCLRILVPYWKDFAARKNLRWKQIPVALLTGRISMKLLEEAVARDFPSGENRKELQMKRRLQQLPKLDSVLSYREQIEQRRKDMAEAIASGRNKIRRYRGNPWL